MEELIDLAIVLGLVLGLGWLAHRLGQSPIPAYFLGGVLLGPNGPGELGVVEPSEPLQLLADLGGERMRHDTVRRVAIARVERAYLMD